VRDEARLDFWGFLADELSVVSEDAFAVFTGGSGLVAVLDLGILRGGSSIVSSSSGPGLFDGSRKAPGFCLRFLRFGTLGAADVFGGTSLWNQG
jgi:hypothetical protein